jgi:hypothetical protein
MRKPTVAFVLTLAAPTTGCGCRGVTIEREAKSEDEISPEERRINENLQKMMDNPMGPPPGLQEQQEEQ